MEFTRWPSILRMSKERVLVTEKIDGSNAAIRIRPLKGETLSDNYDLSQSLGVVNGYALWAQSRKRFLLPVKEKDNFGFAKWVDEYATELLEILGPGDHFGEWWGQGIQRGYGLTEKRFSLFNAPRWSETLHYNKAKSSVPNLYTVPMMYAGSLYDLDLDDLRLILNQGSIAVPGFKAEGMVVYLREANVSYKVFLENDDIHKWQTTN